MKAWEYRTATINSDGCHWLNRAGEEGWEAYAVSPTGLTYYLKRPKLCSCTDTCKFGRSSSLCKDRK